MAKIYTLLNREQAMKRFHIKSRSSYYDKRRECLESPYSDAIISDTGRHHLVKAERFEEFLEWQGKQRKIKLFGLGSIKDKRVLKRI